MDNSQQIEQNQQPDDQDKNLFDGSAFGTEINDREREPPDDNDKERIRGERDEPDEDAAETARPSRISSAPRNKSVLLDDDEMLHLLRRWQTERHEPSRNRLLSSLELSI